ncbi:MAG: hypothetical protein LBD23_00370 [Oscillospiraceae bacterium]|jgi:hypothetical protein|nr:hypothetical protein [Oscillospiraceae bacterium]
MLKKQIPIYLLVFAMFAGAFLLVACSNGYEDEDRDKSIPGAMITDMSIINSYSFVAERVTMPHVTDLIHTVTTYNNQIFFCYTVEDYDSMTIVVEGINTDGTQVSLTKIPVYFDNAVVMELCINKQGNLVLIVNGIIETESGFDSSLQYMEYTLQGEEITKNNFDGIIPHVTNSTLINRALITEDGKILILASNNDKSTIYFIDNYFSLQGQIETAPNQSMYKLHDGRVFISDIERGIDTSGTVLREVDFATVGWANTYPVNVTDIHAIYPSMENDIFDIYVDDGTNLFGYSLTSGEKSSILNWNETGVFFDFRNHVIFSSNEKISLFINHGSFSSGYTAEYVILTRTERTDLPDVEVITIGGFGFRNNRILNEKIHEFNMSNQNYIIETIDYRDYDTYWTDENSIYSELRFLTDLITGQAPDIIIIDLGSISFLNDMSNRGFILDLYQFIDDDPVLDRADFFPNILAAIEAPDGSLPAISKNFSISTMIGISDMVGDIESWTFADMLMLIEQKSNTDLSSILFEWMTAQRFLETALYYSGSDFVDLENNIARIDSEEFIHLLEIASRLAREVTDGNNFNIDGPITRMLRKEQLFDMISLSDIRWYQMYASALGDDMTVLGIPTQDGGSNIVHMGSRFAISANSKNKNIAWDFIRRFLLPDVNLEQSIAAPMGNLGGFPLRIDLFDKGVAFAKIPNLTTDENGNEIEIPWSSMGTFNDMVDLYAMTDTEEVGLRAIIDNANVLYRFDKNISDIIQEELPQFLNGRRSTSDTARVMQNRVQTYLNEMG